MEKLSSKISYNRDLSALERVLSNVARPGEFYARGSVVAPLPRLEVQGVGVVSFPVHPVQARELAEHATLAPYGRGEETIVDPKVRRVWQFGTDQFSLGGSAWANTLQEIVSRAARALGCDVDNVRAEPYKLLLYEKDGFFLSHRDTEKTSGMFGTLVVVFPSAHTGGDLVIRHAGREAVVNFGAGDVSEISYAAFYADCQHEVRPITSGNRLCLVCNLALARGKTLVAPENSGAIQKAGKLIREALAEANAPIKLVYLLEHEYTPDGLSFDSLKNHDRAVGAVLAGAAAQVDCALHLGIVHIEENGPAEIAYSPRYGHRRRYYDDEGNREDEDAEYTPIEVTESSKYVSNWKTLAGLNPDFGSIPLGDEELLPAGALDNEPPDSDRVTEATGNEGATFERSYRRAALVLWKRERYAEVLLQSGIDAAMPYFQEVLREGAVEKEQLREIARKMIERWAASDRTYRSYERPKEKRATRAQMLDLLGTMEDGELIGLFANEVLLEQYDGSENKALARNIPFIAPGKARKTVSALLERYLPIAPKQCSELFGELLAAQGKDDKWRSSVLVPLCGIFVRDLSKVQSPDPNRYYWNQPKPEPFDAPAFALLFKSVLALAPNELPALAEATAGNTSALPPDDVIAPALPLISKNKRAREHPAFVLLWLHAARFLLRRSEYPPVKPADWARPVNLEGHCADCVELERFAANTQAQVHGFRIREDRRRHLEAVIQTHKLDISCRTEERGSPKTLVCTKNLATYERECARHSKDLTWMKTILPLLDDERSEEVKRARAHLSAAIGREKMPGNDER